MLRSGVFLGVSSLRVLVGESPWSYYMKYCSSHQGQQGDVNQSVRGNYKHIYDIGPTSDAVTTLGFE